MAHNQEMIVKYGKQWGNKVRIIGLSIDDSVEKVANHCNKKGWTSVEHY